jgi:membrane associated rhomboid family serine protease
MFGNLTPMVKNLLLINVGIFLIQYLLQVDFVGIFGLRYFFAETFRPYQIFTHMFIHGGGWHLFTNMFALFIFGPTLERVWGSQRFLTFYLITGFGASLLYSGVHFFEIRQIENAMKAYVANPGPEEFNTFIVEHASYAYNHYFDFVNRFAENPDHSRYIQQSQKEAYELYAQQANIPMVGASGAIFGILMAFGLLFPNTQLMLLFPPIPIKAKYFVTFYGLYELYAGFGRVPGDNVAHFAHLGGMLFAFILIKMWGNKHNGYY